MCCNSVQDVAGCCRMLQDVAAVYCLRLIVRRECVAAECRALQQSAERCHRKIGVYIYIYIY